jgi:hypothetical protein
MKRLLSIVIALLLLAVPVISANAAGSAELGELYIASETVCGEVGQVVRVNFELYPNLPEGEKLETLSGVMKYDREFVTLGAINYSDEEKNLTSLMNGKGSMKEFNINNDDGTLRFAFFDIYGVEAEGFWFQAEFRIEQEGAASFLFNGISYSGINVENNDYQNAQSTSYYIEPVTIGGVYTEGTEVPTDEPEETYEPFVPTVNTPAPVTPTPEPSNGGHNVPVTSTLPTYSVKPSASGIVTPPPAVTSMPVTTPVPVEKTEAPDPSGTNGENESSAVAEGNTSGSTSPLDDVTGENIENITPDGPNNPNAYGKGTQNGQSNTLIVVGVIIGIVAVLGLGALAIVLILKRRKLEE